MSLVLCAETQRLVKVSVSVKKNMSVILLIACARYFNVDDISGNSQCHIKATKMCPINAIQSCMRHHKWCVLLCP